MTIGNHAGQVSVSLFRSSYHSLFLTFKNRFIMKTRPSFWLALLCSFVLFFSVIACQKSVNSKNTSSTDSSLVFSATIAGTSWKADSVTAVLLNDNDGDNKTMTIRGFSADTQIVVFLHDTAVTTATDSSLGVHAYAVGYPVPGVEFSYLADRIKVHGDSTWQHQGIAQSGQATVTASSATGKKVSGTFSFTAAVITIDTTRGAGFQVDTVAITNGVFTNIPYSYVKRR